MDIKSVARELARSCTEVERLQTTLHGEHEGCDYLDEKKTYEIRLLKSVVRKLAECLDVDAVPEFANEGDMVAWIERKNAILTHSLVVAERGAPLTRLGRPA